MGSLPRSIIGHHTVFTAAVIQSVPPDYIGLKKRFPNRAESEKVALQNYLGLSEMLSDIGKLPEWLEAASSSTQSPDLDVVVLAALYGYDALLQKFKHSPSSLNQQNSTGIWPLSAAALGDNESTCRLLVRLGADPNYMPSFGDWFGPLHHAVYKGSTHLVEVLLDLGADINHRSNIHHGHLSIFASVKHRGQTSALALAIGLGHWETAFLLVHREAEIDRLAFDLAVQSGNSILIDLLLSEQLLECVLDRRMMENDDGSVLQTVPENSDGVNRDEPSRMYSQQITRDFLLEAASSGSPSLVSRILKMKTSGLDQRSLQDALARSLERGFEDISCELVRAGAKLTHYHLALSFRSFTLTSIREFIATSHNPPFWAAKRGLQELTLELAILNNTPDVVQFAFEEFPQAYSSGALSAAVLRAARSGFDDSWEPMNELLLRRSNMDSEQLDPILENTALAIAILFQAPEEAIGSLLQTSWPEMPAICYRDWEGLPTEVADYHGILIDDFLARRDPQSVSYVHDFHYDNERLIWHSKQEYARTQPILLSTLAIRLRHDQVCAKLMAKGFLADIRTIEAAIKQHTSLDVLEKVLRSCDKGYDIIRFGGDILHFTLDYENYQAMRHFIHDGANVGVRRSTGSGDKQLGGTVLQRAVRCCHFTGRRHFVQLLLDAGADVNEAPAYRAGLTALQQAARHGQLDLARQLVGLGADINARRAVYNGKTCLEAAAWTGRLDMIQFLLDEGATTTGNGQLQYIRAVKMAKDRGRAAVAQILRKHRPWDDSDESLFQEKGILSEYVLHPIEYTAEEIRDLTDEICSNDPEDWKLIWPRIRPPEKDETDLADDVSRAHPWPEVNRPAPMHDDLVMTSTSDLAFDVLDDGSPGSRGSETGQFSSQMVVSNATSNYIMPLHTSFAQSQEDPDFHERIFDVEDD